MIRAAPRMSPILLNAIFDDPATKWLAIGATMLLIVYAVFRPMAKRKRDPLEHARPGGSMSQQRSVEREMSNLLVELSEMARQVTAQLDTRSAKLEVLMKDADDRIATLQQLSGSARTNSHPPENTSPFRQTTAEHDALMQRLDPPPAAPAPQESPEPQVDARHAEIYALADQGRTPVDIATRLGRPSGEIELILALRQ